MKMRIWSAACLALSVPTALANEGEKPNVLGGDIANAIWTLVIFGVLLAVLKRYAWPPLLRALQQREQMIHDALVQAKLERTEAEKLLAEYRRQIDRAREEATAIVEEGKRDAEAVRRRIHDETQAEARELVDRAKREIQLATDTAVKSLYDQTADLAVTIAGQVLGRAVGPDEHRAWIGQALEQIRKAPPAAMN
jgi:F-type H+-transporting ATPase subunit b